ncbi:MAG: LapA family protein [Dolichospermum sp.]
MGTIRLIILVTTILWLITILVQNFLPSLPLVFLGVRSRSLPLGLWVLLSIIAGVFTSLVITSLLKFATNLNLQEQQSIPKSPPNTSQRIQQNAPPSNGSPQTPASQFNDQDDWDTNQDQDDWDDSENLESVPKTSPESNSRTSSVYSYSSQEPKNTAVGKTEAIYDADYRVIIPPHQEPNKNQADDDWDFLEDDDFEDRDENKPPKR